MKNTLIVLALVIVVGAFIVGSFKGSEEERKDEAADLGAQRLQYYKLYTTASGVTDQMMKVISANKIKDTHAFIDGAYKSLIPAAQCALMAQDIFNSRGYLLNDDENKVLGAVKQMKCLMDVQRVEVGFDVIRKTNQPFFLPLPQDQWNWIGYLFFLSPNEQKQVSDILEKLPFCIVNGKKYNKIE